MKPLQEGRRALIWLGVQFADDDVVSYRKRLARKAYAFIIGGAFIGVSSVHMAAFLRLRDVNVEEFFFILLQFVMTAHGSSSFIMIYLQGSHISTVIQSLTNIYEKCEQIGRKMWTKLTTI